MISIQNLWVPNTVQQTQWYPFSRTIAHEAWSRSPRGSGTFLKKKKRRRKQVLDSLPSIISTFFSGSVAACSCFCLVLNKEEITLVSRENQRFPTFGIFLCAYPRFWGLTECLMSVITWLWARGIHADSNSCFPNQNCASVFHTQDFSSDKSDFLYSF